MERAITLHNWYARENARITKWLSGNHTANAALQRIDRETTAIERVVELVKQHGGEITRREVERIQRGRMLSVFESAIKKGEVVVARKKNPRGEPSVVYRLPTDADQLKEVRRNPQ